TNTDPSPIDFPIPANDDATKSISLIMGVMVKAIEEGLEERKMDKEADREREAAAEDESGERTEGEKEYAVADDADDSGETKTKAPAKKAGTRSRRPTTRKKSED